MRAASASSCGTSILVRARAASRPPAPGRDQVAVDQARAERRLGHRGHDDQQVDVRGHDLLLPPERPADEGAGARPDGLDAQRAVRQLAQLDPVADHRPRAPQAARDGGHALAPLVGLDGGELVVHGEHGALHGRDDSGEACLTSVRRAPYARRHDTNRDACPPGAGRAVAARRRHRLLPRGPRPVRDHDALQARERRGEGCDLGPLRPAPRHRRHRDPDRAAHPHRRARGPSGQTSRGALRPAVRPHARSERPGEPGCRQRCVLGRAASRSTA